MPKIELRIATSRDVAAIVSLIRERDEQHHPEQAVLGYLANLDSRQIVVWLAEVDGAPAGINAMYLCAVSVAGQQHPAGYWAHLYVTPKYRKAMIYPRLVFAMLAWARTRDLAMVYTAMRRGHVTDGHLKLGFRQVGTLSVLAKPLRPAALVMKSRELGPAAYWAAAPIDFIWSHVQRLRRIAQGASEPTIREMAASAADLRMLAEAAAGRLRTAWNSETWNARFQATIEGWPYIGATAIRDNGAAGWILFRVAQRSEVRAIVVMELACPTDDPRTIRALLACAERRGEQEHADVVIAIDSDPGTRSRIVRASGYWKSPESYTLIFWANRSEFAASCLDLANWQYSFAEHDAF